MPHQNRRNCSVLIVDLAKRYGGAEVRVLDTARSLDGRYPYAVATLEGSPLHQRLEAAKLVSLPVPFSRSDPRVLFFVRRAVRQEGYLIVDAHNVQSQFWGHLAAMLAGAKKVSTVHSAYRLEHNNSLKGRMYELVLRLNAQAGGRFVAVSEAVNNYLQDIGISSERISLIHNSIHLANRSSPNRNHPLLKSLRWDEDVHVVIVVARLEPVKGHKFLIEALGQMARERPRLRCLIVGEGRTRRPLDTLIESADLHQQVHLAGFRDDIPALLDASDAFCLPSLSEGLPYALLEACAHCLPVLATRVGGMADFLVHKQTAYLTPPADPEALAEGLGWLMDHPREAAAMGQAAFDDVRKRFDPDEMLRKTLAVYQQ